MEYEVVEQWRTKMQIALALSRTTEETLADLVAAYTPLLAPIIPAAIGYGNVRSGLEFDWLLALVYAVIVEFLGLATTTTALQFRAWNKEQNKKAPLWLALLMVVFYLVVVLTVNVLLDTGTPLQKFVKAAASTFSIVGAVTMALRNEQAKRVAENQAAQFKTETDQREAEERAKAEKLAEEQRVLQAKIDEEARNYARLKDSEERARRHEKKMAQISAIPKVLESSVESSRKDMESSVEVSSGDWRNLSIVEKDWIAQATRQEVMKKYNVTSKTAKAWQEKLNAEENHA